MLPTYPTTSQVFHIEDASKAGVSERVLVTGAGGFIGSHVVRRLVAEGYRVRKMLRAPEQGRHEPNSSAGVETAIADLQSEVSLIEACRGVSFVIHCAGYAHAFRDSAERARERHLHENFQGTVRLRDAALSQGVKHFVFLSSVKAMGSPGVECADENWSLPPDTPYGEAKRAAEDALLAASPEHGMQVTNLRLAVVYGPGGRGNIERMARAIRSGWFPPLPETGARRSFVHIADVVDAVLTVLADRRAYGRTFIVAHPKPVSPAHLHDVLARGAGRRIPSFFRVPAVALRSAGWLADRLSRLSGRPLPFGREVVERLLDSECYSPALLSKELGWVARVGLEEGVSSLWECGARSSHCLKPGEQSGARETEAAPRTREGGR